MAFWSSHRARRVALPSPRGGKEPRASRASRGGRARATIASLRALRSRVLPVAALVTLWEAGDFARARACFEECSADPVASLYLGLLEGTPDGAPGGWDGIVRLDAK